MIKVLIAYAGKTGTTKTCVEILKGHLKGLAVTDVDLTHADADPAEFDYAIVGGSVRFAKPHKALLSFLQKHGDALKSVPHGLFLCCGFGHDFEEYSERYFSHELRESAFSVLSFGGSLKLKNASIFEKILLHMIRSHIVESEIDDGEYTPTLPGILPENISMMASRLRSQIDRDNR
jgi:menaquinone-dependent protoporphyrinogen IX oxidase